MTLTESGHNQPSVGTPREKIAEKLRSGELSSRALTDAYLTRIARYDDAVGAFITVAEEEAREQAEIADTHLERGEPVGPLHGLPIGIKDNIDTAGTRTTVGSRFFAHRVPTSDAEVVRRLREAGAVIVGKLSLPEFAYGGTTPNAHHGDCRNPWDLARIPGGSSGGAGAALAADFCACALGTDTGGSVRSPAALNGVSALRPTLGRVSSAGVFPITWSFDTVGPMARSVSDLSAVYEVLAGLDPSDPRSVEAHLAARDDLGVADPSAVRIGLPSNFYFDAVDPEIVDLVRRAATVLEGLGCATDEVAIPGAAEAEAATRRMISAEALAIHAERLATDAARFGEDVRRRLSSGEAVTGPQYARDVQTGREWRLALSRVFDRFDVLLTPTAGVVAPLAAQTEMIETTRVMTRLTYGWTLAGLPVLALPCGFSGGGLPVGLQLIARPWAEQTLFTLGAAFQRETRWHMQGPSLDAGGSRSGPGTSE
jgi:aspartyl-tRNA(Asn)/glutamyl-tRNA(Gln) amidotransferase subunit A